MGPSGALRGALGAAVGGALAGASAGAAAAALLHRAKLCLNVVLWLLMCCISIIARQHFGPLKAGYTVLTVKCSSAIAAASVNFKEHIIALDIRLQSGGAFTALPILCKSCNYYI